MYSALFSKGPTEDISRQAKVSWPIGKKEGKGSKIFCQIRLTWTKRDGPCERAVIILAATCRTQESG